MKKMNNEKQLSPLKYNVDLCLTQYGNYCVYVNNYRVIGQSHQGMMKTINSGTLDLSKIDCQIEKKLKALAIIKEKGLSLLHKSLIISSKNYEEYRQEFQLVKSREFKNEYFYSRREYESLKEVLL